MIYPIILIVCYGGYLYLDIHLWFFDGNDKDDPLYSSLTFSYIAVGG